MPSCSHSPKGPTLGVGSVRAADTASSDAGEVGIISEKPLILPCAKVARICNVTGRTVRNWLASGRLAGIRRNGRLYVLCHSLEEFLRHDR
jgi:hypothetical protein